MNELDKVRKVAVEVAREAGEYMLGRVNTTKEISHKSGPNNLVTDVDKKCEAIIVERINKEFPKHSILAEEGGEYIAENTFKWVVDPLDGTTNYAHGFPFFCVSIGVFYGDSVKLGIVFDPSRDEFFMAEEGVGSFLNDQKISVSSEEKVSSSLIATGFAYEKEGKIANIDHFKIMLDNAQAVRRAGSAAIDLCYVACGRFDGFWELDLSPWDTAAGGLIVKEAGGTVTMLKGEPYDIYKKEIAATNGKIHGEMLGLLGD